MQFIIWVCAAGVDLLALALRNAFIKRHAIVMVYPVLLSLNSRSRLSQLTITDAFWISDTAMLCKQRLARGMYLSWVRWAFAKYQHAGSSITSTFAGTTRG